MGDRILDSFADGQTEASGGLRVFSQSIAAGFSIGAGAGYTFGSPGFHHYTAIGFLIIADFNHVNFQLNFEHGTGQCQSAPPLSGTGFGSDSVDTLFLIVISLGDGGVGFMASRRAGTLVFVKDFSRRIQSFFQIVCPV
jgi:hypothetical protein